MVMSINLETVAGISRSVVLEYDQALHVDSVTFSDGGSERVEVLVTMVGCHDGPCRFAVNVTRADDELFEREFRTKLRGALLKHNCPPPPA
jgi:hypothetical protein